MCIKTAIGNTVVHEEELEMRNLARGTDASIPRPENSRIGNCRERNSRALAKRPAAPNILNFLWVDQFNTSGLGKDKVIVTGTTSDSMLIFDPKKEMFSTFRMPYPMPFYTRGLEGRTDNANGGWKGRGL
jgi:hypothetical protein